jgi:tRNA threonylcarbamoyladenosine biosynthesis protein TsaE
MKILTQSAGQTLDVAKKFAGQLKGGQVIGLIGQLGAGKTVFVSGLAAGLGLKQRLTSPTFVLMKLYRLKNKNRPLKMLAHIDAYRLTKTKQLEAIGADEYFKRPDTVTVIEWADKIKKVLPKQTKYIKIEHRGIKQRIINL